LPIVRQLRESEAAQIRGKLELGARVTIPDLANADADGVRARQKALDGRDKWLERLRRNASIYPRELVGQQLLAEAECRSGNAANCLTAANQALAIAPADPIGLSWKGSALAMEAQGATGAEREARLQEARSFIVRANHADTESVVPLLAYYRSYQNTGQAVPDDAIDGVAKSLDAVPSAPATRLMLGTALADRRDLSEARQTLLPLAEGAFDPPEKPEAQKLLQSLAQKPQPGSASTAH
jgi:predicted Zn-dependent protease